MRVNAQTGHMQPPRQEKQGLRLNTTSTGRRPRTIASSPGCRTSAMAAGELTISMAAIAEALTMCVQCVLSSYLAIEQFKGFGESVPNPC